MFNRSKRSGGQDQPPNNEHKIVSSEKPQQSSLDHSNISDDHLSQMLGDAVKLAEHEMSVNGMEPTPEPSTPIEKPSAQNPHLAYAMAQYGQHSGVMRSVPKPPDPDPPAKNKEELIDTAMAIYRDRREGLADLDEDAKVKLAYMAEIMLNGMPKSKT